MFIEEIKGITRVNATIKGTFSISKVELKPFKQKDGSFLQCELTDRSGSLKGILWDGVERTRVWLKNKMVVDVDGEVTRYNDVPQIVIKSIKECLVYERSLLLPALDPVRTAELVGQLLEKKKTITDPVCQKIWDLVTTDPIMTKYCTCPGGVGDVHHNYLGGLLEHSLSLINTADLVAASTPTLNRDIALTGCLLHDIGKILAYNWDVAIEMTDQGRLLHHTILGYGLVKDLSRINKMEGPIILQLFHIIISHHGDEGMTKPQTPEALVVSGIDAMDAQVNHAVNFINTAGNRDGESNWTRFCNLTQRKYYTLLPTIEVKEPEPVIGEKHGPSDEHIY